MGSRRGLGLLKGSWDLVTGVIIKVTILITPIRVLITLLTKSHDPPSIVQYSLKSYSNCELRPVLWLGPPVHEPQDHDL